MEITASTKKGKRYTAIFNDGTTVDFGLKGGSTYIDHKDKVKRENYRKRHSQNPLEKPYLDNRKKYYKTPSVLSMDILWGEKDTLEEAKKEFIKKYIFFKKK